MEEIIKNSFSRCLCGFRLTLYCRDTEKNLQKVLKTEGFFKIPVKWSKKKMRWGSVEGLNLKNSEILRLFNRFTALADFELLVDVLQVSFDGCR